MSQANYDTLHELAQISIDSNHEAFDERTTSRIRKCIKAPYGNIQNGFMRGNDPDGASGAGISTIAFVGSSL